MPQNQDRLQELYTRFYHKTATEAELAAFIALLERMENDDELSATMKKLWQEQQQDGYFTTEKQHQLADHILKAYSPQQEENTGAPVHRIHFLKTAWFRYAATILLLLSVGAYFWFRISDPKPDTVTVNPSATPADIAPGGNKAVLMLADGSHIVLDTAANGHLASQGNTQVTKLANGQLAYSSSKGAETPAVTYNTLKTPRGGQYRLTLPDGTQVWLNAASSITYPTAFTGDKREVSVTGEAYFEVSHLLASASKGGKRVPFIVLVPPYKTDEGGCSIEVLGTHFNINAYRDEPTLNTTLLEGKVVVRAFRDKELGVGGREPAILKPGQQALIPALASAFNNPSTEIKVLPADVEQVMAWKNGAFNFNDKKLEEVMRQLSRWYDVEVMYEGKTPDKTFYGQMGRDLTLTQCLKILEKMQVHFRIETGRRLVVMP